MNISLARTTFCEPLQTLRPFSTTKTGPVTRKLVTILAERVSKQAEFAVPSMCREYEETRQTHDVGFAPHNCSVQF